MYFTTFRTAFLAVVITTCSVPAVADVTISPGIGGSDTPRIQAIIDSSSGTVRFKAGIYRLNGPLVLRGNRTYSGEGSWDPRHGSTLQQQMSGAPIFRVDGLVGSVVITGLTFDSAPGAGAKGIAGNSPAAVLANSTLRDNFFLTGLAECIDVAMQATRIERNSFGLNGGSIGPKHRHIRSASAGEALETNANWIVGNHFSQARGTESVLFTHGGKVHFVGNDFQGNAAETTLRIYGMFQVVIDGNYFEQNAGEAQIIFGNSRFALGNYSVRLKNNYYHMGGFPGGTPNRFIFNVDTSYGPHHSYPGQTQVFMEYEVGTFFSPGAELTSSSVFQSCYLWITGPPQAFRLNGYTGSQLGRNPNCQ